MNKFRCQRCGRSWQTQLDRPKCCRWCGTTLWDKPRVRGSGAGRPKGSAYRSQIKINSSPVHEHEESFLDVFESKEVEPEPVERGVVADAVDHPVLDPGSRRGSDRTEAVQPPARTRQSARKKDRGPNTRAARVEDESQTLVDPEKW